MPDLGHVTVVELAGAIAILFWAVASWRTRSGSFYKAVAEERQDEVDKLREELNMRRKMTDLTPIVESLGAVSDALNRHATTIDTLFNKVSDLNGSMKAHEEAMKSLAKQLVVDEAARTLLRTAAESPSEGVPK